jgi:Ca2+-binding RTX toxin-like protein
LSFVDNHDGTATLSGTPAPGAGGTYTFTITASNGIQPDATQTLTLTVAQAAAITSADATSFVVGSAGSFVVSAAGFALPILSIDGAGLPAGLSFSDHGDGTATLAGTPALATAGHYSLTIRAHNGVGTDALQTFTLIINPVPPTVASPTVSALGSLTATLGGNVTSVGGGPLTKRGIVYSLTALNPNPMLGGPGVIEVDDSSAAAGVFSREIRGLQPGTSYTFTAFATNGLTVYTDPVSFTTTRAPSSGISGFGNALAGQSIPFTLSASDPVARWQAYYFVYRIKWGDGTTSTVTALNGATTSHAYANPGTYLVQVTATNGAGTVHPLATISIAIHAHVALEGNTLYVTGSKGNDTIALSTPTAGTVGVAVNSVNQGTFAPDSIVIVNSAGTDTLVGPDSRTPTTWTLTGAKSGVVTNSMLPAPVAFSGITNLTGASGDDIFLVQNATSGFASVLGGGGQNSLDYSQVTSAVTVNLLTKSATKFSSIAGFSLVVGGAANDHLTADNSSAVTLVGGAGNDTLTAGAGADVLLGGTGADVLIAGAGRSLLVGGSGADRLMGGSNDTILIAGLLSYYDEVTGVVDVARLNSIMSEWLRPDLDFASRIANLQHGTGVNQSAVVNPLTIQDDKAIDSLFGSTGADWFLVNDDDLLSGNQPTDSVTTL